MNTNAFALGALLGALFLPPSAAHAHPSLAAAQTVPDHSAAVAALSKRVFETFEPAGMAVAVSAPSRSSVIAGPLRRAPARHDRPDAVTADSLFSLASTAKAFTSAALALLVDEGRLAWDDKVVDYLPGFELKDPWVTAEFTIRDLLTHRSGLPMGAGDLLFWPDGTATRNEMVAALRHFAPESSFRSTFAYDNLLYVVAGEGAPD